MSPADVDAVWNIVLLALAVFAVFWLYAKIANKERPALYAAKAAGVSVSILVVISAVVLYVVPSPTPATQVQVEHAGETSDGVEKLDI